MRQVGTGTQQDMNQGVQSVASTLCQHVTQHYRPDAHLVIVNRCAPREQNVNKRPAAGCQRYGKKWLGCYACVPVPSLWIGGYVSMGVGHQIALQQPTLMQHAKPAVTESKVHTNGPLTPLHALKVSLSRLEASHLHAHTAPWSTRKPGTPPLRACEPGHNITQQTSRRTFGFQAWPRHHGASSPSRQDSSV